MLYCTVRQGESSHARDIGDSNAHALYADLFEIAAGLISEHDAEVMDTLQRCTQGLSGPE